MTFKNIASPQAIADALASGRISITDPSIPEWALWIWQMGRLHGIQESIEVHP